MKKRTLYIFFSTTDQKGTMTAVGESRIVTQGVRKRKGKNKRKRKSEGEREKKERARRVQTESQGEGERFPNLPPLFGISPPGSCYHLRKRR